MARIAGVNLPREKRLEVGLTYIYGIGPSTSRKIAAELGLSPDTKVRDLTDEEITKLRTYIDDGLSSKATFAASARRASNGSRRSARTVGCATGAASR